MNALWKMTLFVSTGAAAIFLTQHVYSTVAMAGEGIKVAVFVSGVVVLSAILFWAYRYFEWPLLLVGLAAIVLTQLLLGGDPHDVERWSSDYFHLAVEGFFGLFGGLVALLMAVAAIEAAAVRARLVKPGPRRRGTAP